MDGQILGYLTAAGALSGVIIAVVNGILTRKRTGAETTEKVVNAAGGLLDRFVIENERLVARQDAQDKRIQLLEERLEVEREERQIDQKRWERERIANRHILQVHVAWDTMALQKLTEAGLADGLPEVPPLSPPTRSTDYPQTRVTDPREMS